MARSGDEGLEQRLDRWVEAGRQFVDGVSGARPGSRGPGRTAGRRSGAGLNPAELGRWVENKLDWLLEEDASDDWREPWQPSRSRNQAPSSDLPPRAAQPRGRRRPLEAISRRPAPPLAAGPEVAGEWPDDELFSVPRWQRQQPDGGDAAQPPEPGPLRAGRPLPRSTRRR